MHINKSSSIRCHWTNYLNPLVCKRFNIFLVMQVSTKYLSKTIIKWLFHCPTSCRRTRSSTLIVFAYKCLNLWSTYWPPLLSLNHQFGLFHLRSCDNITSYLKTKSSFLKDIDLSFISLSIYYFFYMFFLWSQFCLSFGW